MDANVKKRNLGVWWVVLGVLGCALAAGAGGLTWKWSADRERARVAERLARQEEESRAFEAERARLARRAEQARASARIQQLQKEIAVLHERDQNVVESLGSLRRLDPKVNRASAPAPH